MTWGSRGRGSEKPVRAHVGRMPWCTAEWQAGAVEDSAGPTAVAATPAAIRTAIRRSAVMPPIPRAARGGSGSGDLAGTVDPFDRRVDPRHLEDPADRPRARHAAPA